MATVVPRCLLLGAFQAQLNGRIPQGRTKTRCRDHIFQLTVKGWVIQQTKLEDKRMRWSDCSRLQHHLHHICLLQRVYIITTLFLAAENSVQHVSDWKIFLTHCLCSVAEMTVFKRLKCFKSYENPFLWLIFNLDFNTLFWLDRILPRQAGRWMR